MARHRYRITIEASTVEDVERSLVVALREYATDLDEEQAWVLVHDADATFIDADYKDTMIGKALQLTADCTVDFEWPPAQFS